MLRSVHPDVIKSISSGAIRQGHSLAALYESIGAPSEMSEGHDQRFPKHMVDAYTQRIKDILQDEALGFLDHRLKPGTHEYCCRSSINSRNVREVFQHIAHYFSLVTDSITFELKEEGENARFKIAYPNPNNLDALVFISFVILTIHRWVNWLSGKKILLEQVNYTFEKPEFALEYDAMFGTENNFSQDEISMVFHRRFLDFPVVQTAENLESLLPEFPNDLVARLRLDNSLSAQVQRMLQAGKEVESLPFTEIAQKLLMSTDTLRRRLKEEGSSFAQIKESVRYNSAVFWLTNTDMPINSIALRLGFSEPSAFNRAFKKWAGKTPGDFRQSKTTINN